jgi:DNA-binding MarR family transcriptional regulator
MVSSQAKMPPPLPRRLRDGLERIANVLRSDRWRALEKSPLNPTQAQILTFLLGRESKGARVNAIAQHIGVSQPTATDSIISLEKKGLAKRHPDPGDRRAVDVAPTEAGRALVQEISAHTTATDRALAALSDAEQRELLGLLVKIIRNLQNEGTIAPQRMCVTCRYFRPHVYEDARAPHHCAYVNAPFGAESLRLDCEEHDASPAEEQERVWKDYVSGFLVSNDAGPTSP